MKTMKMNDTIVRVSESKQFDFLRRGYEYVSKSLWKKEVRDGSKKSTKTDQSETVDDKSLVEKPKKVISKKVSESVDKKSKKQRK